MRSSRRSALGRGRPSAVEFSSRREAGAQPSTHGYRERIDASALSEEFRGLFLEFESIDSPASLYSFQVRLAAAISSVEPAAFRDKQSTEREHLRRLRQLGDGVAWRYLHPYTIRQLAKNDGGAPALSHQSGFAATMAMAKEYAERGEPVVVCDLTNCLRVGDVVVCSNPERPILLESGGNPRYPDRGRKGRQRRRAAAIDKLLRDGQAHLEGDPVPTETLTIDTPMDYSWSALQSAIDQAVAQGYGVGVHSPFDVIWATSADSLDTVGLPPAVTQVVDGFRMRAFAFMTVLDRPNPRMPPPATWQISASARLAVLQSDVLVVHVVDVERFRDGDRGRGRVTAIETQGSEISGMTVEIDGISMYFSPAFLDEVLGGFQTIESTRDHMLACAAQTAVDGGRSFVGSVDDAIALLRDPEALAESDYVSMPLGLVDHLRRERRR